MIQKISVVCNSEKQTTLFLMAQMEAQWLSWACQTGFRENVAKDNVVFLTLIRTTCLSQIELLVQLGKLGVELIYELIVSSICGEVCASTVLENGNNDGSILPMRHTNALKVIHAGGRGITCCARRGFGSVVESVRDCTSCELQLSDLLVSNTSSGYPSGGNDHKRGCCFTAQVFRSIVLFQTLPGVNLYQSRR